LWDLDTLGHHYGANSGCVKEKIKELDYMCEMLFNRYPNDNFLFWSDHGMVDVKGIIKPPEIKNSIMFLDSTLIRIWTKNKKAEEILSNLKNGKLLTKKDKVKYKINFKDNRYGDLIYLADPHHLIYPNYYNRSPVKAMHGYDPFYKDQYGFYLTNYGKSKKDLKMVDMFNLCLNLINK
jgi:predicted AlkP superfamily pyrophosphatase or phosphodiesterase